MLKAYPGAPLYTALYEPEATFPEFADHDVRPLWTNRIGALRRDHRRGLLLYPLAFSGLRVDAEMVLCSSSGFAHGVRTTGRKVVYCYTPPRWLYDQAGTYLAAWPSPVAAVVRVTGPALRRWDRRAAATADAYVTSSTIVRERIRDAYGIDAEVIPPPGSSMGGGAQKPKPGFMLCVSRLLTYKNVDAVVEAFERLADVRLVVVGQGPELKRLKAMAGPNVSLLGGVSDLDLHWLYVNCAGVVSSSYEDFGLTAIEAATYGKPSAVLQYGGFLDTVVAGETGVFFDEPVPSDIASAVQELVGREWDSEPIRRQAERFTESSFVDRLGAAVGAMTSQDSKDAIRSVQSASGKVT